MPVLLGTSKFVNITSSLMKATTWFIKLILKIIYAHENNTNHLITVPLYSIQYTLMQNLIRSLAKFHNLYSCIPHSDCDLTSVYAHNTSNKHIHNA